MRGIGHKISEVDSKAMNCVILSMFYIVWKMRLSAADRMALGENK